MKILLIGFLAFFGWSALSTYIYVCKIRGWCNETETIRAVPADKIDVIKVDTIVKTPVQEQAALPENLLIYFAYDKSEFNTGAETDRYFEESNAYLVQNSQARLSITGHTDSKGSDEYNQLLGSRRTQSVQLYFESKGLPANKIISESRGEKEPADDNNTTQGRAKNRRAVITIKH